MASVQNSRSRVAQSRGVAADELRRHNLESVLKYLHLTGSASRSELTSITTLNRSTIADLVAELTMLGLVEETPGSTSTGPGRPSPIVAVRPEGVTVLAVEIAVDSVAVATVGLGGHIYNNVRVARPRGQFSPEATIKDVAKLAGPLLDSLPAQGTYFAGVGVAAAGVVRRSDGLVVVSPNLGWEDVPLAEQLAKILDVDRPISVANEADLAAVAEHRRGGRTGINHLIYVSGEVGLGTGVILDGEPLLGLAGYAGEAGHTLVNPDGLKCRCGAIGCWETEAGEAALLRHAGLEATDTGTDVLESIYGRARVGDPVVLAAIAEIGRWLGVGIGNLINTFNPELIVLGGMYHRLFEFLEGPANEAAKLRALAAPLEMAVIAKSALGNDAPLIGAAELMLSDVIANPASVSEVADSRGITSDH